MKELKDLLRSYDQLIREIEKSHEGDPASNSKLNKKQLDYYRGIREGIRLCLHTLYQYKD